MYFRIGALALAVSIGVSAAPALAQEAGICTAQGGGSWIGGDQATSDVTAAAATLDQTGVVVPPGGNVVLAFDVNAAGEYRVEANPQFGGDTVIELYTGDGALVLTDDDSGGNWASRAEANLEPGTYCLLTRAFGGGGVTADVRVARADQEPITGGLTGGTGFFAGVENCLPDTPATQLSQGAIDAVLGQGVSMSNTIASTPYYRFTLASPQAISIRAENEWADPYIYLFDGAGTLLAENDDYDGFNSRIDMTEPLSAGTYCIAMRALSDPNQPVTLTVRGYDPAAAMMEMYATGEASPPEGSGYPVTDLGILQTRLVMDQPVGSDAVWYAFSVPDGGLAVIDAVEITDSDPVIRLFGASGRMIAYNDDSGGTLDSQITTRVAPGRYLLGVTQYSDGYRGIIRVSIERFVPAQ